MARHGGHQEAAASPVLGDRSRLMRLIEEFNVHRAGRLGEIEVRDENGQLVYEGVLRIYWGVKKPIVLASGEMGDLSPQRRRRSGNVVAADLSKYSRRWSQSAGKRNSLEPSTGSASAPSAAAKNAAARLAARTAGRQGSQKGRATTEEAEESSGDDTVELVRGTSQRKSEPSVSHTSTQDSNDQRRQTTLGIPEGKMSGTPLKRSQSSDQWHAVMKRNTRKTKRMSMHVSPGQPLAEMFTPPHGSVTNLRATSLQSCSDIVQALLTKLHSIDEPTRFALFVIKDTTEKRRCRDDEVPMYVRLRLGPSEEVAKLWVMEAEEQEVLVSPEMEQYFNLAMPFLEKLIERFEEEEEREAQKIRQRFAKRRQLLEELIEEKETEEKAGELV